MFKSNMKTEILENLTECYHQHTNRLTVVVVTIYNSPSDFIGKFVARIHLVKKGGATEVLPFAVVDYTLDRVRAKLPPNLTIVPRSPEDGPQVVESWI